VERLQQRVDSCTSEFVLNQVVIDQTKQILMSTLVAFGTGFSLQGIIAFLCCSRYVESSITDGFTLIFVPLCCLSCWAVTGPESYLCGAAPTLFIWFLSEMVHGNLFRGCVGGMLGLLAAFLFGQYGFDAACKALAPVLVIVLGICAGAWMGSYKGHLHILSIAISGICSFCAAVYFLEIDRLAEMSLSIFCGLVGFGCSIIWFNSDQNSAQNQAEYLRQSLTW
jgi:hypothetical protein